MHKYIICSRDWKSKMVFTGLKSRFQECCFLQAILRKKSFFFFFALPDPPGHLQCLALRSLLKFESPQQSIFKFSPLWHCCISSLARTLLCRSIACNNLCDYIWHTEIIQDNIPSSRSFISWHLKSSFYHVIYLCVFAIRRWTSLKCRYSAKLILFWEIKLKLSLSFCFPL